jgi:poly(A) polymerase
MASSVTTTNSRPGRFGVTDPVSTSSPTEEDFRESDKLVRFLTETGFFESEAEGEKREAVLGRLNTAIKEFVRETAKRKGLPAELCRTSNGKIFTFGSYRLGVHSRGADIDTLCVAPQHVTRDDFFTILPELLKSNHSPPVTLITAVPDAYVPVLNLEIDGICIDLVFARIPGEVSISDSFDLLNNKMLASLEEKCVLSVNGSRTTDEILRLVPSVETFHTALRAVKFWAKRRALYGNSYGYLNGVACAILTARVCQWYPNATASVILSRFFYVYSRWNWPSPIYLKTIEENAALGMKVWNPRINMADRHHRMPIITPAYPSMCSTHNVSDSTMRLMLAEFNRANELCPRIQSNESSYADLFQRSDYFIRFRNFFQVIAISCGGETEYRAWSGYVESRVRHLTMYLEREADIDMAPPYPEGFEAQCEGTSEDKLKILDHHTFSASSISPSTTTTTTTTSDSTTTITATEAEPTPKPMIHSMAFYIGISVKQDASGKVPRKLLLDRPVNDFKTYVCGWEKMQPNSMFLLVRDVRRDALPDYVYKNGPPRPPPSLKKSASNASPKKDGSGGGLGASGNTTKKRSSEALSK